MIYHGQPYIWYEICYVMSHRPRQWVNLVFFLRLYLAFVNFLIIPYPYRHFCHFELDNNRHWPLYTGLQQGVRLHQRRLDNPCLIESWKIDSKLTLTELSLLWLVSCWYCSCHVTSEDTSNLHYPCDFWHKFSPFIFAILFQSSWISVYDIQTNLIFLLLNRRR